MIHDIQASGVRSLAGIAQTSEARGVETPAGRQKWRLVQVTRLLGVREEAALRCTGCPSQLLRTVAVRICRFLTNGAGMTIEVEVLHAHADCAGSVVWRGEFFDVGTSFDRGSFDVKLL